MTTIKRQCSLSTPLSSTTSLVQIGLVRHGHNGCSLLLAILMIGQGELTCASSADFSCKLLFKLFGQNQVVTGFWGFGVLGSEGVIGSGGVIGAEEDKGAAIYLMLDG